MPDVINFINLRKPVEMLLPAPAPPGPGTTSTSQVGHAVTLFGYRELNNQDFVSIWDSNENSGKGGMVVLSYNPKGTVLPYPRLEFTWVESIVWANSSHK